MSHILQVMLLPFFITTNIFNGSTLELDWLSGIVQER